MKFVNAILKFLCCLIVFIYGLGSTVPSAQIAALMLAWVAVFLWYKIHYARL